MPHGQNDEERGVITDEDELEQEQAPQRENAPHVDTSLTTPISEGEKNATAGAAATSDAPANPPTSGG